LDEQEDQNQDGYSDNEVEEIEFKNEPNEIKNGPMTSLSMNKLNRVAAVNSQPHVLRSSVTNNNSLSGINSNNNVDPKLQLNSQQLNEVDISDLLRDEQIAKYLNLKAYLNFKPPIYEKSGTFFIGTCLFAFFSFSILNLTIFYVLKKRRLSRFDRIF
jgi:hypothetical protein